MRHVLRRLCSVIPISRARHLAFATCKKQKLEEMCVCVFVCVRVGRNSIKYDTGALSPSLHPFSLQRKSERTGRLFRFSAYPFLFFKNERFFLMSSRSVPAKFSCCYPVNV